MSLTLPRRDIDGALDGDELEISLRGVALGVTATINIWRYQFTGSTYLSTKSLIATFTVAYSNQFSYLYRLTGGQWSRVPVYTHSHSAEDITGGKLTLQANSVKAALNIGADIVPDSPLSAGDLLISPQILTYRQNTGGDLSPQDLNVGTPSPDSENPGKVRYQLSFSASGNNRIVDIYQISVRRTDIPNSPWIVAANIALKDMLGTPNFPYCDVRNLDPAPAVYEFRVTALSTLGGGFRYVRSDGETVFLESKFVGATPAMNGLPGLVPEATPADQNKYLKGDGTWADVTQVQADWNETDNTQPDFIKNKPTIPDSGFTIAMALAL
jgi:hypothetical protein